MGYLLILLSCVWRLGQHILGVLMNHFWAKNLNRSQTLGLLTKGRARARALKSLLQALFHRRTFLSTTSKCRHWWRRAGRCWRG